MSRVSSDDTIGQLLEAEQGQATPLIDCSRQIASGNLVLDQGYQPHSSLVPEEHRQIEITSDGVDTVSEHSLPSQHQSRTGVPFLDLASASDQTSNRTLISTPTTMSDQGSVGGDDVLLYKECRKNRIRSFGKTSFRTEGQARNSRFKGVWHPLFKGNGHAQTNIWGSPEFCAKNSGRRNRPTIS